jgi:RimJ/RimL family protein N-acetyltransferase
MTTPPAAPPRPLLAGPSVTLRPLAESDAPALYAASLDREARRLAGALASSSLEELQTHCRLVQLALDRIDYAITRPPSPEFLGETTLNMIDWDQRSANFRIMLARSSLYGQGLGTEAAGLLMEHGFMALGLHRIELEVFAFNERARHVYERLGFVTEGRRRDALHWDGAFHDSILMSMLRPEYLARRLSTMPR